VEVDAMLAAGPIRTSRETSSAQILRHIDELAATRPRLTSVSVSSPLVSVSVSRQPSADRRVGVH